MKRNSYASGLAIIAVGVFLLLAKFGIFGFVGSHLWPIFVLLPSLFFHVLYFARGAHSGVLVPGGILLTYSLMFFYCNFFGWGAMAYLWPGYILGVAVGLFESYYFDPNKPRGVLIASGVLATIAAVFFGFTLLFTQGVYLIAIILILIGAAMIYRRPRA